MGAKQKTKRCFPKRGALGVSESKKVTALMIVIGKIIARYQNQHAGNLDEEIFKLFEKAKVIKSAKDDISFQSAIANL